MQSCCKCQRKFSYIELLSSTFGGYKNIKCKSCNSKFKVNQFLRWFTVALVLLPIYFREYLVTLGKANAQLVFVLYEVTIILITPLIVRYKLIEENE